MLRRKMFIFVVLASLLLGITAVFANPTNSSLAHDDEKTTTVINKTLNHQSWKGAWAASPQPPYENGISQEGFENQTVRMIIHPHASGEKVRLRFSNVFGSESLTFGNVGIALSENEAGIVPGSNVQVTFSGERSITIPPGAEVISDPLDFKVKDDQNLAVSVYIPEASGPTTWHNLSRQTSYISESGDHTEAEEGVAFTDTDVSWFWLSGVDVLTKKNDGRVIVTLGDSITDGHSSTIDANLRWPDILDDRLDEKYHNKNYSVLNAGISGNKILRDSPVYGVNALARLNRDVLSQTGATDVILLEGINDIGHVPHTLDSEKIIDGMEQIAAQAHAKGLRIYAGTLLPFRDTIFQGYFTEEGEVVRQEVNEWIRTSGVFDGVIDFDKVMQDPENPQKLRPEYDAGDHLHPNDPGYQAMADAIDLALFRH
ncbi:SGNH/GDSL hydrolase family protein [Alkalihalobacillus sp. TS-13]|uniref:SGNH/GDSL hydrolase family protein n=1 Tax=Alkalihalobacillus sp. TS-13 TaxID=2842455 RepID=UPI0021AAAC0E|nr:SGNH/GDSL hydrolase family protein [Alkalihalobacillus sp. TS-13]